MSAESDKADGIELTLDRKEAWVVHYAVLDHIEFFIANSESLPQRELALLEKIETGATIFTAPELRRLRELCTAHVTDGDVPDRDVAIASAVIDAIDDAFTDDA